tara:strand:+ start:81 stop:209 length:129 start_codon:yes stop_codon:yes gene_type:complete
MNRIEKVRLAMMILNKCEQRPETAEEIIALVEKIIKKLKLND